MLISCPLKFPLLDGILNFVELFFKICLELKTLMLTRLTIYGESSKNMFGLRL